MMSALFHCALAAAAPCGCVGSVAVPKAADGQVTMLEPRLAASSTEWPAPFAVRVAVVVFAPRGLDAKQTLRVVLPWPSRSPKAPLFVWLRGESEGRATKVSQ